MQTRSFRTRRLALVAFAAVVAVALLATPATAFAAKAATRIVATKSKVVYRDVAGLNPWDTTTLSAKLQKKVSGKYRSYSGTVKLYLFSPVTGKYVYLGSKKGSSVTFSLPRRGKYKLYFAGTSTAKSSVAYTKVYEDIGLTVGAPAITFEAAGPSQYLVTVKYAVNWNTEATAADPSGIVVWRTCEFEDSTYTYWDGWASAEREIYTPGTVEFTYKVDNSEIMERYLTIAGAYGNSLYRGDYIISPADVTDDHLVDF